MNPKLAKARLEKIERWTWDAERKLVAMGVLCGKTEVNGRQLCSGQLAGILVQDGDMHVGAMRLVDGVYRPTDAAAKVYRAIGGLRSPRTPRRVAHLEKHPQAISLPISLSKPFTTPVIIECPRCGTPNQVEWDMEDVMMLVELRNSVGVPVTIDAWRRSLR